MKKALILTYYWPPAGGSGVQRWLKFVKYFRDFGVEPVVFTVENPQYPITDESLQSDIPKGVEVLRQPIFEPNKVFSFFGKKNKQSSGFLNANPSFFGKALQYVRANYFIPDARKFWIQPSVKTLKKYLENNDIDVVISTGPPHSVHLIAQQLQQTCKVKWIADFRDPWTQIDYFHQLPLTKKSIRKHHELEQSVLKNADAVVVVSNQMKEQYNAFNNNVHVITNGFDGQISEANVELDNKFSITHIGMMNDDRNPKSLWKALHLLMQENTEFAKDVEVKLVGKVSEATIKSIAENNLNSVLNHIDYVSHEKAKAFQKASQVLLLAVNNVPSAKGIVTGKIFEYLLAKRPILAIGPTNGDLAQILETTNAGTIVDFDDVEQLKKLLLTHYNQFKNDTLAVASRNIEQFHRKTLTEKMAELIKDLA